MYSSWELINWTLATKTTVGTIKTAKVDRGTHNLAVVGILKRS